MNTANAEKIPKSAFRDEVTAKDYLKQQLNKIKDMPKSFRDFFQALGKETKGVDDIEQTIKEVEKDPVIKQLVSKILAHFRKQFKALSKLLLEEGKISSRVVALVILLLATGLALMLYKSKKVKSEQVNNEHLLTEDIFSGLDKLATKFTKGIEDAIVFVLKHKKLFWILWALYIRLSHVASAIYIFVHAEEVYEDNKRKEEEERVKKRKIKKIKNDAIDDIKLNISYFFFFDLVIIHFMFRDGGPRHHTHQKAKQPFTINEAYGIMGLPSTATPKEVKRKFKELVKKMHPDHAERLFKEKEGREPNANEKEAISKAFRNLRDAYSFLKNQGLAEALDITLED